MDWRKLAIHSAGGLVLGYFSGGAIGDALGNEASGSHAALPEMAIGSVVFAAIGASACALSSALGRRFGVGVLLMVLSGLTALGIAASVRASDLNAAALELGLFLGAPLGLLVGAVALVSTNRRQDRDQT